MFSNKKTARYNRLLAAGCVLIIFPCFSWGETVETPAWIVSFAESIYDAWHTGKPMPQISGVHPNASMEEAYKIQKEFVSRIMESEEIGGYKAAGVANPAPDHPLTAVMPASGILYAKNKIVIDLSEDPTRHVETEIGYVFGKAIREPLTDVDLLRECVKAVTAIVEIPGGAVEKRQPGTENDIIAWNINAKAMISGTEYTPKEINPDAVTIVLKHNGKVVNTATGDKAAGGQWNTLLKTVNTILNQGYSIQPGHIITNGALGKILKAVPGQYHADFGDLGVIVFEMQ